MASGGFNISYLFAELRYNPGRGFSIILKIDIMPGMVAT